MPKYGPVERLHTNEWTANISSPNGNIREPTKREALMALGRWLHEQVAAVEQALRELK